MKVSIYRQEHFTAAHRLHIDEWSAEKNREIFGKCNNPNFHGHNYVVDIKLTGVVDPLTGYFMNLKELKQIIIEEIIDDFDHKNLNVEVPEFQTLNTTVENIAVVIWDRMRKVIDPSIDLGVRVYETPRNFAEYSGPDAV